MVVGVMVGGVMVERVVVGAMVVGGVMVETVVVGMGDGTSGADDDVDAF
jgi:hypothetical protein